MTTMRNRFVAIALAVLTAAGGPQALSADQAPAQAAGLKIVVIAGENAVNIIQQKTAVGPIVEVRDRNDLPVAGAVVTFTIPNAQGAIFSGGLQQLTVTTNAVGRAQVAELTPIGRGPFEIQIRAAHQGQTTTTSITQRNFASFADAAAGDTAPTPAEPAAAAPPAQAVVTIPPRVGGGGMSGLTKTLIFGGLIGGGGFAAYKVATRNHPPTLAGITASPGTVLLGTNTAISFTAQAADEDDDALIFDWNFGDGTTSTSPAPTKVYTTAGAFTVSLTISDGKETAASSTSVNVRTLTGTWRSGSITGTFYGTLQWTLNLSQNGSTVSGSTSAVTGTTGSFASALLSGSVRATAPRINVTMSSLTGTANTGVRSTFFDTVFAVDPSSDVNTLTGIWGTATSITLTRQ